MPPTPTPMPTTTTTPLPRPVKRVVDEPGIGAWRTFLQAHARITRRLDEELQAAHGISLAEYDALLQIADAPGHRVRMNVLANRVLLSRSGITRLVDRLEAAGSVERIACNTDARGQEAVLTAAGLDRLRTAADTHLDGVRRYFLERFDAADVAAIERSLGRVAVALEPDTRPTHEGCPPAEA
ncbi:MAG TPA: MarR family winged helix-turn-helix transcriptional regulator [Candidatus Limnocylindrales bacterium]|nr:MarR family winged helix-turn-helix transcriptional regulator [Candidatus Limnocylindrales bacterium]